MKKIIFLLLLMLFFCVFSTGCSRDSSDNATYDNILNGDSGNIPSEDSENILDETSDSILEISGTAYYVSNSGSDSKDGLTPEDAWATINHVNSQNFSAGDGIFFKRGDTWRETLVIPNSGSDGNHITFAAYGTGNKPRLYGSNKVTNWVQDSTNDKIWVSENSFIDPYDATGSSPDEVYIVNSNIEFGEVFFEDYSGRVVWGNHKDSDNDLSENYDWTWQGGSIYIYSTENPAEEFYSVEVAQRNVGIFFNQKSHLTFDKLDIRYNRAAGFKEYYAFDENMTGLEIKNCHIGYISNKGSLIGFGIEAYHSNTHIHHNDIHETGRRAISIYTLNSVSGHMENILIEDNVIYNSYHTGVDLAAFGTTTVDDIVIRNNYFYEDFTQDSTHGGMGHVSVIDRGGDGGNNFLGVEIYRNTMKHATGPGVLIMHAENVKVYHNTMFGVSPNTDVFSGQIYVSGDSGDCEIKNNLFYNTMDYSYNEYHPFIYMGNGWSNFDIDHNVYYLSDPANVVMNLQGYGGRFYFNSTYHSQTWDEYRSLTGFDENSTLIFGDPGLVDPENDNFNLGIGSFPIDEGVTIPGFNDNYLGDAPDPGAYESSLP